MNTIIRNRDTVIIESGLNQSVSIVQPLKQYVDVISNIIHPETYADVTEVIPNKQTQVLQTSGKMLLENVIVKPIPNNYGLIMWNGSFLTVS